MAFTTNAGVVAVKGGAGAGAVQALEFRVVQHFDVLGRSSGRAAVAVFDDFVALGLHHPGKAKGFPGEGAVAVFSCGAGVEDSDEVEAHQGQG